MEKIFFSQFDYFPFLIFIYVFSVFLAALLRIPFDIFYCSYVFFEIPNEKPNLWITNAWFWISSTPSATVICLNWCIIFLAMKKNNIDNLTIFSLDFYCAICCLGLLCGVLFVVTVIIGFAYILIAWALVHWFKIPNIDTSGDTVVS